MKGEVKRKAREHIEISKSRIRKRRKWQIVHFLHPAGTTSITAASSCQFAWMQELDGRNIHCILWQAQTVFMKAREWIGQIRHILLHWVTTTQDVCSLNLSATD